MTESSHNWKIFWINLDRSTERRERFEERLRDFQLTDLSQRVKAVDGLQEYKERITPETVQKMDQYHLSLSEMACTLSHLDAVRLAHDSDTEFCLILEDDTTFEFLTCPFIEKLNDIVSRAPQKWQVLQIGVTYLKEKRRLQIQRVRQHAKQFLARKSEDWGSNAYILSRTAMEQLVERHWNDERKQ